MKKSSKPFGQYIFDNHNYGGTVDDFFEETALAIGSIVHSFNSLDAELNSQLCELINDRTDLPGVIVIHKLNFSTKVDLFYRLIHAREIASERLIPCFNMLIENLKKCATLRNAVIHAEWDAIDDNGYTYVKMHFDKNGMRQHYWQFTPESLDAIDEFIHNTYMLFDTFDNEKF